MGAREAANLARTPKRISNLYRESATLSTPSNIHKNNAEEDTPAIETGGEEGDIWTTADGKNADGNADPNTDGTGDPNTDKKEPVEDPTENPKNYVFNGTLCSYDVIFACVKEMGWKTKKQNPKDFSLYWIDPCMGINEAFATIQPWQTMNHFPGLNDLIARKSRLFR